MNATTVRAAASIVHDAEKALEDDRAELARALRKAREAGATIQELMDWTGYSRRMIFYLLKDKT